MAILEKFPQFIEPREELDAPANAVGAVMDKTLDNAIGNRVLSGAWLGHPLHPLMVTLPIGAWSSALVFDLTKCSPDAARQLIGLGLLTALPTSAAGAQEYRHTKGAARRVTLVHAVGNSVALTCYATSYLARRRGKNGLMSSLVGAVALGASGYLGGHLSYKLGVGVEPATDENIKAD